MDLAVLYYPATNHGVKFSSTRLKDLNVGGVAHKILYNPKLRTSRFTGTIRAATCFTRGSKQICTYYGKLHQF